MREAFVITTGSTGTSPAGLPASVPVPVGTDSIASTVSRPSTTMPKTA